MKRFLFVMACGALGALGAAEGGHRQYGAWTSCALGGGGYLQQAVWAPSDTRRLYLTSDVGGLFRSDDGGGTWHMLHGALPSGEGSCMTRGAVVHPKNPDRAVFAIGGTWPNQKRGIYVTDDAGRTMKRTLDCIFGGNDRTRAHGAVLINDPIQENVLYAAPVGKGPMRSDDFGLTWKEMGLADVFASCLVRDRTSPTRMWVVASWRYLKDLPKWPRHFTRGFFVTEDGKTWTKLMEAEDMPVELVQDGTDPTLLHGVFSKPPSVRWSKDGGKTWNPYENPAGFFPKSDGNARRDGTYLGLASAGGRTVLGGFGANFYTLESGSLVWKKLPVPTFNEGDWYPAGDAKRSNIPGCALGFVALEPGHPDHWLFTDWYACYLSPDAGKTWNLSIDGIEMTVVHTVTQDPAHPERIHVGVADIGYFRSDDGGRTLRNWGVKRGISNNVKSISVCAAKPDVVYATAPQGYRWYANQLFRSTDGGDSWTRPKMKGLPSLAEKGGQRINTVAVDPKDPDTVYVAVSGAIRPDLGGVWKSVDAGETFTWISQGMSGEKFFKFEIWMKGAEFAISPDGSMVAASHDTGKVFVRPAGAAEWTKSDFPGTQSYVLCADALVPGRFFMTRRDAGVWRSTDGGRSWKKINDRYANGLAVDAVKKDRVAFFTGSEAVLSTDGGEKWSDLPGGLPYRDARNPIAFGGDRLYVGTGGNGVFSIDLKASAALLKPQAVSVAAKSPEPPKAQEPQDPLGRGFLDSVEPEGAKALVRWGEFNGSFKELEAKPCALPSHLKPGESARLPLKDLAPAAGDVYLRLRVGFRNGGGAGLAATLGTHRLWNEIFLGSDAGVETAGNFGPKFSEVPFQVNRICFVPREELAGAKELVVSNPGTETLAFDAVQLEVRTKTCPRSIGLDAFSGFSFPEKFTQSWGHSRMRANTQMVKAPGTPDRFKDMEAYADKQRLPGVPCQATLEGTPEWLAMTPERMQQARQAKRPKWVAPRPDEYADVVEEFVRRNGSKFSAYEVWNEADISHFYRGTSSEYATLFKKAYAAIRKVDPKVPVMPAGMANFRPDFIDAMKKYGVYDLASCVVMHPYCGQSPCWDLPYGQIEGYLYSRGVGLELYPHESGFTSANFEWFKGPPDWTPERQAEALSIAMARILASGAPRLTVFHAGGMNHAYGLIDEKGNPKPAYGVFESYAALNGPGAVRLDASLVRQDGKPLRGVYVAGSRFEDGRSVFVVNPVQSLEKDPFVCELVYSESGKTVRRTVTVDGRHPQVIRTQAEEWRPKERLCGFNLLGMFCKTKMAEGDRRIFGYFPEDRFRWMKAWGFNFARLPLDYRFFIKDGDWMRLEEAQLKKLDEAVAYGRKYGIHVNIDFHRAPGYCCNAPMEPKSLFTDPEPLKAFVNLWVTLAKRYKGIPNDELTFDLVNEPATVKGYGATPENYAAVAKRVIEAIREVDSERFIMSDGWLWGNEPVKGLRPLPHNVGESIHCYSPHPLTHYGVNDTKNTPVWPPAEWKGTGREWLERKYFSVWESCRQRGEYLHLGEFGFYHRLPHDVAMRWTEDVLGICK